MVEMACPYCNASNLPDDHRCQRCGRRLETNTSGFARPSYGRGGTARALQIDVEIAAKFDHPIVESEQQTEQQIERRAYQRALYNQRVVSLESYAPEAVQPQARTVAPATGKPRMKRAPEGQGGFEFETVVQQAFPVRRTAVPTIACNHRVAHIQHRLLAAAIDLSMVVVALTLFVGVVYLGGWRMVPNTRTAPLLLGLAAFFYVLYEVMWCLAGTDTAGMRWSGLRLVNFDGERLAMRERLVRAAGGCLSVLSAGLGVVWALVDEESLTWHDHMSKTFPTSDGS